MDSIPPHSFPTRLTASIERAAGLDAALQAKILVSLLIIIGLWLVRMLVVRLIARQTRDARDLYTWRKWVTNAAALIGILMVGRVWFAAFGSLATFVGLIAAGLAIALRDLLVNFAGWFFIIWRRPFAVGDRVQIGGNAGDVIDLRIFQFTLLEIGNWVSADQATGRIIHVPNGKVFTEPLFNYTKGFNYIWNEITVLVTFESDWRKAKGLLQEIAIRHAAHVEETARESFQNAAQQFLLSVSDLTPIVYTTVPDSGVLLTIRYLCNPHHRRAIESAIWEEILAAFAKCQDIDFAYPTTRFYDNASEGKDLTRPGAKPRPKPEFPL
ncbi:mechanosensitive ion channel family protein [bacterium]|nr:mechanosensitive ion channel family protein [bacterium]MBU1983445.1 mechanosensitive ion channel family protein [bacterium]